MLSAMVTGDRTFLRIRCAWALSAPDRFTCWWFPGCIWPSSPDSFSGLRGSLRIPRVPATLVTIAAAFAYALFTGFATPVQRSLWMVTLYLLGRLVYRERNALNHRICRAVFCLR